MEAARAVEAAVAAAQELLDGVCFAPGEEASSFNLDDLELSDALFEAKNSYSSPKQLLTALNRLSKVNSEAQRRFWTDLCAEANGGSPPRQLAAYLSFLVAAEKRNADKVVAACTYLQLVQIDGCAAYGMLKANSMLRIVSTLSVIVSNAFRKPVRDEGSKESEEDAEDEDADQEPVTSDDVAAHIGEVLGQLGGVASHKLIQHQHDVVERCVDLCILGLCLASAASKRPGMTGVHSSAAQALVRIAQSSAFAYTCVFRSVFPLLTMKVRDPRLPDAPKTRIQFHKVMLSVLQSILQSNECPAADTYFESLPGQLEADSESSKEPGQADGNENIESEDEMEAAADAGDDDDEEENDGSKTRRKPNRKSTSPSTTTSAAQAGHFRLDVSCVLGLMQRLCMQAPEKADYRATVANTVVTLLPFLNEEACTLFLRLLTQLAKSSKTGQRAFAVDIAGQLLLSPGNLVDRPASMGCLFGVILGRCSDKAPNVRTRAISILHDLLCAAVNKSVAPTVMQLLRQSSLGISVQELAGDAETSMDIGGSAQAEAEQAGQAATASSKEQKSEVYDLIEIIRDRVTDDKATVRRTAILAFEMVLSLPHENEGGTGQDLLITDDDISLLMERCGDVSLAVRRQAMISLSNLVMLRPGDAALQDAWVQAVLPMVSDPESSVQQKLAAIVKELLYDAVVEWNSKKDNAPNHSLAVWNLASRIIATDKSKLLHSCVTAMLRQGLVTNMKALLTALRNACTVETRESEDDTSMASWQNDPDSVAPAGWLLLEALMVQSTDTSSSSGLSNATVSSLRGQTAFVLSCWRNRKCANDTDSIDEEACRMLRVVTCVASSMPKADAQAFLQDLLKIASNMQCAPNAMTTVIRCLKEITAALASDTQDANAQITEWSNELLQLAHSVMHTYVWQESPQDGIRFAGELEPRPAKRVPQRSVTVSAVQRAMCIVGEVSMLGFSVEEDAGVHLKRDKVDRLRIPIPQELVSLIKVLMAAELPSANGVTGSGRSTPLAVRAHAFVAMGKVCMRDFALAKDMVNVFVRELVKPESQNTSTVSALTLGTLQDVDQGSESIVRSNALLVLGDLCIRYTNLVDRHVGAMAACLQDSDPLVRKHAFVLLTQLLLQDYVKWRGLLLHRFLVLAVDDDAEVSQVAEHVLCVTLLQKYPTLFASHFVECIIVLNNFCEHPTYQAAAAQGAEGSGAAVTMEGVQLDGPSKRKLRLKIYAMMLEGFTDEQKISVTAKLTQEILAFGVDNPALVGSSREKVEDVIRDALLVLRSPLLKVTGKAKGADTETEMDDEAASIVASVANAKGRVLAKVARQHLAEQLLPTVLSLKHTLERCNSSLQRDVMSYLVYVNQTYKEEMSQVLSSDPLLKQELEYDMKQFEQNRRAAARRAGAARGTPFSKAFPSLTPHTARRASVQEDRVRTAASACKLASASRQAAAGRTPSQALREARRQSIQPSVSKQQLTDSDTEEPSHENDDTNTHYPPTTPRQRRWSVTFVRKESAQSTPTNESPSPLKQQASKRGRSAIHSPDASDADEPASPTTPIAKPAKKARGKRKSVLAAR